MSFTINEYSIIPNEKRPKLYLEMQTNPYNLEELDLRIDISLSMSS